MIYLDSKFAGNTTKSCVAITSITSPTWTASNLLYLLSLADHFVHPSRERERDTSRLISNMILRTTPIPGEQTFFSLNEFDPRLLSRHTTARTATINTSSSLIENG